MSLKGKKSDVRQQWTAARYAAWLVLRLKPRLFVAGLFDELINRIAPFVEAFLLARIITLLPDITLASGRSSSLRDVLLTLAAMLLVRVIQQTESSLFGFYQSREQVDLDARINRQLIGKFASLPYSRYEEKEVLDQYDLATHYSGRLSGFVLYELRGVVGALFTVALAAVAIIHFSVLLAVLLTLVAIPQLIIEFRVNRLQRRLWRQSTVTRRKAATFQDLFQPLNIKESRLFGLVQYALDKALHFDKASQLEQLEVDRGAEKYRLAGRILDAVAELGALAYVARLIYIGAQPIGQFVFAQQILLRYSGAMTEVMRTVQDLDEYLAGSAEFFEFMKLPDQPPGITSIDANLPIQFHDVSFTYPGAKSPALQNISLTIHPGQTVAFVGVNGAGKTTLVKLLMKLYDPTRGSVTIGGAQLQALDENAWHEHLGVLFQDFVSFTDFTVRENVKFGRLAQRDDDAAIKHALRQAGALEFVKALPNDIDTYLGKYMDEENGTLLSGGQLQRLAIARVLFRDPSILIMDEPTSAIDAKAEYDIFRELDKARQGKTTVLISHRFSTVRKADYIYVLHKGRLVEQGTHNELMGLDGQYAGLFNAQAEGYR